MTALITAKRIAATTAIKIANLMMAPIHPKNPSNKIVNDECYPVAFSCSWDRIIRTINPPQTKRRVKATSGVSGLPAVGSWKAATKEVVKRFIFG